MEDKIEKISNEISIVIYDNPLPPKYIKIKKKFIKQFIFYLPLFLISLFIGLFFLGIVQKYSSPPQSAHNNNQESKSLQEFQQLKTEINELKTLNNDLNQKLNKQSFPLDDTFLLGIKRPYGMQNLTSGQSVSVDQFNLSLEGEKLSFKFQILSTVPETKIMGHILVAMISQSGVQYYPQQELSSFTEGIKFSSGEPFSVSRLRPTNATFNVKSNNENVSFIIYIFNRLGDLLLIKQTDPFKIGNNK